MNIQEIKDTIKDLKDGLNSSFTPEQFKPRMEAKIKELESKLAKATPEKSEILKEKNAKRLAALVKPKATPEKAPMQIVKKSVPVAKSSTKYAEDEEGYCDKVIAKAKERRAKAKAQSKEPKKAEVTKNTEKIDKVIDNVKERAKNDSISVSELQKLIKETQQLLDLLKSRLSKMK